MDEIPICPCCGRKQIDEDKDLLKCLHCNRFSCLKCGCIWCYSDKNGNFRNL